MVAGKQSKCQVLTLQRLAEGTSKIWRTNLQFLVIWHRDHSTTRVSSSLVRGDNKTYLPMGFFCYISAVQSLLDNSGQIQVGWVGLILHAYTHPCHFKK